MKKLLKITAFVLALVLNFIPLSVNASTDCSAASTHGLHQNANAARGEDNYCFKTPETLKMKFHEFGLCTTNASPGDKTSCTALFASQSGAEMELTVGNVGSLIENVSMDEGLYTHAYLITSNEIEISAELQFDSPRTDDSGNSGVHCFTDGRSMNSSASIISCAQSPNVQKSSERLSPPSGCGAPSWGNYGNSFPGYSFVADGVTLSMDVYMIQNDGTLSNNCNEDFGFFVTQPLASDINITPDTIGLNIAVALTGSVSLGFNHFSTANTQAPTDAKFNGFQFIITQQ